MLQRCPMCACSGKYIYGETNFFLGRLYRVDLINPVSNDCPSNVRATCVCTYVFVHYVRTLIRTFVRLCTKPFFDFNKMWHVDRGRCVMHGGMQYDRPIPRSRSRALQSWKSGHVQNLSPPPFTMGAGSWALIPKLGHNVYICAGRIFDTWLSFCVTWLKLAETSVANSRPSFLYGANFLHVQYGTKIVG